MGPSRHLQNEGIAIARGLVLNTTSINKFGFTGTDVASNTVETVWDGNGTTPIYPYPADAVITIAGDTNTADDGEIVVVLEPLNVFLQHRSQLQKFDNPYPIFFL